jgi:hypothetical protein
VTLGPGGGAAFMLPPMTGGAPGMNSFSFTLPLDAALNGG